MQELEKILEEIELEKKRVSLSPDCSNEHAVIEIILLEKIEKIIRKHMNDGWIPVEERLPTQEECEDNWFWIAYGDSFGNSPRVARCEWVFAYDENGNDDSGSEFYIDQFPLPYKPSKNLIKAWKIIDIPAPYRPEKEWSMNQGWRLILRKCVECGEEIRIRQIYNPHYSDWEDIEPWICSECRTKGVERNDARRSD